MSLTVSITGINSRRWADREYLVNAQVTSVLLRIYSEHRCFSRLFLMSKSSSRRLCNTSSDSPKCRISQLVRYLTSQILLSFVSELIGDLEGVIKTLLEPLQSAIMYDDGSFNSFIFGLHDVDLLLQISQFFGLLLHLIGGITA